MWWQMCVNVFIWWMTQVVGGAGRWRCVHLDLIGTSAFIGDLKGIQYGDIAWSLQQGHDRCGYIRRVFLSFMSVIHRM